jgi:hypothetical protein
MNYLKIKWIHSSSDEPVLLYSEVDDQRWEVRKVEIYEDGHSGYAGPEELGGSTKLGEEPIPTLPEIASDPQFDPVEITKEEFEEIWAKRKTE